MWRRIGLAVIATLAVAGCTKKDKAPDTSSLGFHKEACPAELKNAECGKLVVEETRGANNGRTVTLPVVIVRATAANKKADPVIFLHGGPGGSVVESLPRRLARTPSVITADRDWIFFDHRGTGKSTPSLDCGTAPLSDAGVTSDAGVKMLQDCGKKWTAEGIDLSQYNSAVIVKDIHDLRKALGVTTYNLYGGSYGTRVAMAVMQHDPEGLRAVVLNSTWAPEGNATAPLPGLVSQEVRQVLAYCAADTVCRGKYPDLERRLDARMTEWLKTPVSKDGQTHTADEMGAFLLETIYSDRGARSLPMLLDGILKGDYAPLIEFKTSYAGYTEGQFLTTLCNEEFSFESPAAVTAGLNNADPIAAAVARDTLRFFPACEGWATGKGAAVENQPLTSTIPTLMLSADIDAGCPAEMSEQVVTRLSKGRNYMFKNRMHTIQGSDCAKAMIAQFLETAAPNVDTGCLVTDRPTFPFIYDKS